MKKKKDNFMNKVLIFMAVFLLLFTVTMIVTFWAKLSVPDTLIVSVFGIFSSECFVMSWIKNTNQKYPDTTESEEE